MRLIVGVVNLKAKCSVKAADSLIQFVKDAVTRLSAILCNENYFITDYVL